MSETTNEAPRFLWKFYVDCGRMGSINAIFSATQQEVDEALGKTVHFGEILGKHSDISVDLEREQFERVHVDAAFVAKFDELQLANGRNPLSYLEDQEADEESEEESDDE